MSCKISKDQLREYLREHTNTETAEYFGVCVKTIARWRVEYELSNEMVKHGDLPSLTAKQKNLLIASILGDGIIEKRCNRFKIGQRFSRREYMQWLHEQLQPYSRKIYEDVGGTKYCRMYTIAHSCFSKMRQEWYKKVKIVPKDLELNEEIVAHWYVQNGINQQCQKTILIKVHSFSLANGKLLVQLLKKNLNIDSMLNDEMAIVIGPECYSRFLNIVRKWVNFDCFRCKLDESKTAKDKAFAKLNLEKARQIRTLYNKGKTVLELANKYNVTSKSIYNVLNQITYHENRKEVAEITMIYNPDMTFLYNNELKSSDF